MSKYYTYSCLQINMRDFYKDLNIFFVFWEMVCSGWCVLFWKILELQIFTSRASILTYRKIVLENHLRKQRFQNNVSTRWNSNIKIYCIIRKCIGGSIHRTGTGWAGELWTWKIEITTLVWGCAHELGRCFDVMRRKDQFHIMHGRSCSSLF